MNGDGSFVETILAVDPMASDNGPLLLIPGSCDQGPLPHDPKPGHLTSGTSMPQLQSALLSPETCSCRPLHDSQFKTQSRCTCSPLLPEWFYNTGREQAALPWLRGRENCHWVCNCWAVSGQHVLARRRRATKGGRYGHRRQWVR